MSIKAIETSYKGYRFRSRLEARWAVFFDALNVKWEYEKEGYDLGEHGWYLPDFWLSQSKTWVEIKPSDFSDVERQKCAALCELTHHHVLMISGTPALQNYPCFTYIEPALKLYEFPYQKPSIADAVEAARSARFEHGEAPKVHLSTNATDSQDEEWSIINPLTGDGLPWRNDGNDHPPEWVIRLVESGYEILDVPLSDVLPKRLSIAASLGEHWYERSQSSIAQ